MSPSKNFSMTYIFSDNYNGATYRAMQCNHFQISVLINLFECHTNSNVSLDNSNRKKDWWMRCKNQYKSLMVRFLFEVDMTKKKISLFVVYN